MNATHSTRAHKRKVKHLTDMYLESGYYPERALKAYNQEIRDVWRTYGPANIIPRSCVPEYQITKSYSAPRMRNKK